MSSSTAVVRVTTSAITDWDSFHDVFTAALNFADYYGRNVHAFIDLLRYPDAADVGLDVDNGDVLMLYLDEPHKAFANRCPEQCSFLVEALGQINAEGIEHGQWVTLALAFPWSGDAD